MKIGILTMVYHSNYGGILQCIALQNTLKMMGHEVEVIRFVSEEKSKLKRRLKSFLFDFSFQFYYNWIYNKVSDSIAKYKKTQRPLPPSLLDNCSKFINENIHYTDCCNEQSIGRLIQESGMDIVIIGSDKIWVGLAKNQLVYMGDWFPSFQGRIISYAACSSLNKIPRFNQEKVRQLMSEFHQVSVRDFHTYALISDYSKIPPSIVADPTLLYDFKEFTHPYNGSPYIFAYILGREIKGGHKAVISRIKERYGDLPVKAVILSNESTNISSYADEVIDNASPETWLNLLLNASFVYTDSFHGILFALKFHKPFLAYYREASRASRLIGLKTDFGLYPHIVSSVQESIKLQSINQEPDYKVIDKKINALKTYSLDFLFNSINQI